MKKRKTSKVNAKGQVTTKTKHIKEAKYEKRKARNERNTNVASGFVWGLLIFIISIFVSLVLFIVFNVSGISDDYTALIVGIVDSAAGAITGGFIIPQLKSSHEVEVIEFYHSFITYWLETDKMFIEHPECRKYFYKDISIENMNKDSAEYQLIMSFAEYFDDLFRYSPAELKKQLKSFSVVPYDQILSYIDYMEMIKKRPAFVTYLNDNHSIVNNNNEGIDIKELRVVLEERMRKEGLLNERN